MIRFIVVEDDKKDKEIINKVISKLSFKIEEEIEIKNFDCYDEKLEEEIKDREYKKVYILDISLKTKTSGIEIAEQIREIDWNSEIIFVTNHDKMFETVYRSTYNIFDFIEKFHEFETRLEKDIDKILKRDFDNQMFKYSSRSAHLSLFLNTILYIYRDTSDRKLCIVTDKNNYSVSLSLQEILTMLDKRFAFAHRACIVNKDRVIEYQWGSNTFVLDNKESVNLLSKKYKSNIED